MAQSHLPTTNDLEFVGIVEGGGYLIFDALCSGSGSDLVSPTSSEDRPPNDEENEGHLILATHVPPRRTRVVGGTSKLGCYMRQDPKEPPRSSRSERVHMPLVFPQRLSIKRDLKIVPSVGHRKKGVDPNLGPTQSLYRPLSLPFLFSPPLYNSQGRRHDAEDTGGARQKRRSQRSDVREPPPTNQLHYSCLSKLIIWNLLILL